MDAGRWLAQVEGPLDAPSLLARADALLAEEEEALSPHDEQVLPLLDRNSKLFRAALDARELNIVDFVTVQQRALQTRRITSGKDGRKSVIGSWVYCGSISIEGATVLQSCK